MTKDFKMALTLFATTVLALLALLLWIPTLSNSYRWYVSIAERLLDWAEHQ